MKECFQLTGKQILTSMLLSPPPWLIQQQLHLWRKQQRLLLLSLSLRELSLRPKHLLLHRLHFPPSQLRQLLPLVSHRDLQLLLLDWSFHPLILAMLASPGNLMRRSVVFITFKAQGLIFGRHLMLSTTCSLRPREIRPLRCSLRTSQPITLGQKLGSCSVIPFLRRLSTTH